MAVLSVPLRGAEVERVPLGFLFQGGKSIARELSVAIERRKFGGRPLLVGSFRDRISARAFLPIEPSIQVGCTKTPHFPDMGAVNLPASRQFLQGLVMNV